MSQAKAVMSPFWLILWSCMLALGWLLPNHYRPWLSFHSDAWVSFVLLLGLTPIIFYVRERIIFQPITILVAMLIFIPWLQYLFGVISLAGNAWISSAYLLGLFLAILAGGQWEKISESQFPDGLFFAIGFASILSVGLQLHQWFQLDGLELWSIGGGFERPHANLGQPNQLGTFLLWGVLATAWGLLRKYISGGIALLMAAYLLFGVALTGSRTAWIGVALLVGANWWWRKLWNDSRVTIGVAALGIYFVVTVVIVSSLRNMSQGNLNIDADQVFRMSSEIRPLAWRIFLDAIAQRPFFGYGWNQVVLAQTAVAIEHPGIHGVFSYSHNIFLDLILWCGIPLGVFIFTFVLWWCWKKFRAIRSAENAVLFLFLLVVFNHAMLELPLYFAYFLFPVGMVMGTLNTRLSEQPIFLMGRWILFTLWLAGMSLLALIIRDYSRVETSYQILRMEWTRIKITMPVGPPDAILLTQWHDYIQYARFEPKAGLSTAELDWMRDVTKLFPGAIFYHKLATALALNQHPEEAQRWLKTMCKMVPDSDCRSVQATWALQALKFPEIAAIPWPINTVE